MGYQSTHNVGGAVMGSDPSTSVVNKYLQSWDVSNLFVVGGSAFPQNPANGPTETIGMLACWAADAIKDSYVRSPGALVLSWGWNPPREVCPTNPVRHVASQRRTRKLEKSPRQTIG